ncbi:transmembrane and coiled-coil domains protein 1 isoform X2 [Folsomia candida]|nr:transmembrane and coiled-coil domains protein 1 isoform X2 [Folsomia candida]
MNMNDSLQYYNSDLETTAINSSATPTIQTLQQKINRAKKRILEEQKTRDENVEEYLKMAAVAQRTQLPQVKAVFEKRNTKAATRIAALQRKLERYQQDVQELEKRSKDVSPVRGEVGITPKNIHDHRFGSEASGSSTASSHRASKGRLQHVSHGIKSVSENLKDGITGISGTVISKPKEIASYLMKQKFGSADNIPHVITREPDGTHSAGVYHGSANIPATAEISKGSGTLQGRQIHAAADDEQQASECSESAQSSSIGQDHKISHSHADMKIIVQQLQEIRDDFSSFREDFDTFKNQVTADSSFICQGLQEERFRAERLEEQVNDLTELHQAETGNLKQALADAEEKLSYQSEERLRDLAEMLEACQTKISRLEQQQQQLVTIEGIENSAARDLAVKLVNVGLTMLQLCLLLVATVASALAPFLGSRVRLFTSLLVGLGVFMLSRKWPQVQEALGNLWTDLFDRSL